MNEGFKLENEVVKKVEKYIIKNQSFDVPNYYFEKDSDKFKGLRTILKELNEIINEDNQ